LISTRSCVLSKNKIKVSTPLKDGVQHFGMFFI
jgi:hypothetical protein